MVFECYQQFFKPVEECRVYITNVPSVGAEVQVPPDVQRVLTQYLNLMSKAFDSKTLSGLPNKQNPLDRVNRIHAMLKFFLYHDSSFGRDKPPGFLDGPVLYRAHRQSTF